jgi:ABC-type sugar transport system ATPase subunit
MLEQNVGHALRVADRVYVMRAGRVILSEPAAEMRARALVGPLLSMSEVQRLLFRAPRRRRAALGGAGAAADPRREGG